MRCMSSGSMFCHRPGHLVEVALQRAAGAAGPSAPRTARCASADLNSYFCRLCTWPARSGGSMSSCMLRSVGDLLGDLLAALRRPTRRASSSRSSSAVALQCRRPRAAPRRCRRRRRRGRASRAARGGRRAAARAARACPGCCSPLRSSEALLHQPAQRRVQVAVVEQVVGDLVEDRVGVEVEPDLRAVPPRVPERRTSHAPNVAAYTTRPPPGAGPEVAS